MNNNSQTTSTGTAKVIYILLLVGTIIGITGVIGLIMAYVNKEDSSDWLQSHYQFQIRTFWIGFLYMVIGVVLLNVIIGYLILVFTFFWIVIRCAKGLKQLENNQPVSNVKSWMFA